MVFFRSLVDTHLFKIQFPTINFVAKFFIKYNRFRLIHQKLNSNGFFRPLVVTHLFQIRFATKNFLAKVFIKAHRFRLIYKKLNSKDFFLTLGNYLFIQFSNKKFSSKISYKNASISTYSLKTEFERFFPTPRCDTFVSNSICYKKFHSKIFHKSA